MPKNYIQRHPDQNWIFSKMRCVFSSITNYENKLASGFDFFYNLKNIFALCDGANSCRNSGILARKLSEKVINNWARSNLDKRLRKN